MASNPMQADLTLLDLPLKRSGAIIASALGEFTAPSQQEVAVLRPGGIARRAVSISHRKDGGGFARRRR